MSDIASVPFKAPFFRRLSTVVVMTISLLFMPIAMIILLTGNVYRWKDGAHQPISNKARYIYGGALVLWLVAATVRSMMQPGGIQGEWERSADPRLSKPAPTSQAETAAPTSSTASSAPDNSGLPACDNPEVIQTAREAIDESPAGVTTGLRVRDVGKGQETLYDPERKVRRCVAEAMLNNGSSLMTYQVLYGPSGNLMVQSQVGDTAMMQYEVDKAKRDEAQQAARAEVQEAQTADPGAEPQADTSNR